MTGTDPKGTLTSGWTDVARAIGERARRAARLLAGAGSATKNAALDAMARGLRGHVEALRAENEADLAAARNAGLSPAMIDRLTLTESGIEKMARSLEEIAELRDPV